MPVSYTHLDVYKRQAMYQAAHYELVASALAVKAVSYTHLYLC